MPKGERRTRKLRRVIGYYPEPEINSVSGKRERLPYNLIHTLCSLLHASSRPGDEAELVVLL